MAKIEDLPADALRLSALNMKPKQLLNFCSLKKRFNEQICKDKIFLRQYGLQYLTSKPDYLPKNVIQELMKLDYYIDNILAVKNKKNPTMKERRIRMDQIRYLFLHNYDKFIINNWEIFADELGVFLGEALSFDMSEVAKKIADKHGIRNVGGHVYPGFGIAVESGNVELVKKFIENIEEDMEWDIEPHVLLQGATRSSNINMLQYILEFIGDKVNSNDYEDTIKTSIARGDIAMLQYLLKYKTNFEKNIPYSYYAASDIIPEFGFPKLSAEDENKLLVYAAKWGSTNIIRELDRKNKITNIAFLPALTKSGFYDEVLYYLEKYNNLLNHQQILLDVMLNIDNNNDLINHLFNIYISKYDNIDEYLYPTLLSHIKNLDTIKYMYKKRPKFFTEDAVQTALIQSLHKHDIAKFFIDRGADLFRYESWKFLPYTILKYAFEKLDAKFDVEESNRELSELYEDLPAKINKYENPKNIELLYKRGYYSDENIITALGDLIFNYNLAPKKLRRILIPKIRNLASILGSNSENKNN